MNVTSATSSFFPLTYRGMGSDVTRPPDASAQTRDRESQADPKVKAYGTENQTDPNQEKETSAANPGTSDAKAPDGSQLTAEELKLIETLKARDQEVRQHEMAHMAAGGSLITSGAQFSYKRGPDGVQYAVGGEVGIDTSAVPGDPQATIQKMNQVKQAALAPASPSPQDIRVASKASARAAEAAGELTMLMARQQSDRNETQAFGSSRKAADTYAKVGSLPETDTHTFQLAV